MLKGLAFCKGPVRELGVLSQPVAKRGPQR